jgi:hypothetical protein
MVIKTIQKDRVKNFLIQIEVYVWNQWKGYPNKLTIEKGRIWWNSMNVKKDSMIPAVRSETFNFSEHVMFLRLCWKV